MAFSTDNPPQSLASISTPVRALAVGWLLALATGHGVWAEPLATPPPDKEATNFGACHIKLAPVAIWQDAPGAGYRTSVQSLSLEVGAAYGPAMMGSQEQHHLALLSAAYGHMFAPVLGEGHWWRGNLELRIELFGGVQFAPDLDWLVGLTPHVRYNFATGSRWTPFLDGGLGVSLTGIGAPDVGSLFEFNIQGSVGVHYHLRDDLALTFEARYIHLSNAGISDQNYGLNALIAMFGVTKFF
jgi:lipid A 3-O-deacylase